ncbi:hypothetical protein RchiOBHm_Chr6g0294671 [Rosa chinensis]|uniref:Uncharacterized protein n=1 Tax=Rosa chinensis TaxID=74649 RepID=A0A2P6PWY4_ROSCH|nr:uncharacterized protein LOC112174796 [Rosa chinensis]PRQ26447.1 hypothetical protein RchiOBHm_Chr6g0294671 [Rosa chinensis]
MAGGARCRVRSGGGLRSSGRIGGKSTGLRSGSRLSTREQQDDLLRRYPGAAYIVTRRRSEPAAGAGAVASDEIISFDTCRSLLYHYYDVTRLCGSDSPDSVSYRDTILEFCGIQVSPDELDQKASTSTNAAPHL